MLLAVSLTLVATVAGAAQTSASFVWQPNSESDLAGYRFYQESGQPVQRTMTKLGLVNQHTVSGLVLDRTYQFGVLCWVRYGLFQVEAI